VRKVFDIVKAVPVNEVFASTEELDDYLDRMQRQVIEQQTNGE
jgi:sigma-B regulation protein RsbU (phosphoserine phosphatase)